MRSTCYNLSLRFYETKRMNEWMNWLYPACTWKSGSPLDFLYSGSSETDFPLISFHHFVSSHHTTCQGSFTDMLWSDMSFAISYWRITMSFINLNLWSFKIVSNKVEYFWLYFWINIIIKIIFSSPSWVSPLAWSPKFDSSLKILPCPHNFSVHPASENSKISFHP